MIKTIGKALASLRDPALRRVFWGSMALSALLLAGLAAGGAYGLQHLPELRWHWLTEAMDILAGAGVVLGVMVLAYPVATLVISVFLDDIAARVEAKAFPGDPPGRSLGIGAGLILALPFLFAVVGLNLLALPFLIWLPGANLPVFWLVNGYLVGREYFELVASRHVPLPTVRRLRRTHRMRVLFAGVVIAVALSIPVVNLWGPMFGTALMVHVFKGLPRPA